MKKLLIFILLFICIDVFADNSVPLPIIDVADSSIFVGEIKVKIKTPNECKSVYYTIDGSDPGYNAKSFFVIDSAELKIETSCVLKAIVVKVENINSIKKTKISNMVSKVLIEKSNTPYLCAENRAFIDSVEVRFCTIKENGDIYYKVDEGKIDTYKQYTTPFYLSNSSVLKCYQTRHNAISSDTVIYEFIKYD